MFTFETQPRLPSILQNLRPYRLNVQLLPQIDCLQSMGTCPPRPATESMRKPKPCYLEGLTTGNRRQLRRERARLAVALSIRFWWSWCRAATFPNKGRGALSPTTPRPLTSSGWASDSDSLVCGPAGNQLGYSGRQGGEGSGSPTTERTPVRGWARQAGPPFLKLRRLWLPHKPWEEDRPPVQQQHGGG